MPTPPPTATATPPSTSTFTVTPSPTASATRTATRTPTASATATHPTDAATPNSAGEYAYVVQSGETIWTIAERWGVLAGQVLAYNQLSATEVTAGVTLRIPASMLGQTYTGGGVAATPTPLPSGAGQDRVVLGPMSHDWQTLNNCGPATMAMLLSYYGIQTSQFQTASWLKPNAPDRNVSPNEMAAYARTQGFGTFVGIGGSVDLLQRLVSAGFPVVTELWLNYDGGVGHFRIVRGFDRAEQRLLANDSFLGPELWFTYDAFRRDWAYYNNTYIVVYPQSEEARVREIIGGAWEPAVMWEDLRVATRERVTAQPDDALAWHGLGEALLQQGKPAEAIDAYEEAITIGLPDRYLWYRYGC